MRSTRSRHERMLPLFLAFCLVAGQCLAVSAPPELPDPGSPRSMNRDQQRQIGLQVAGQVYTQMPVLPDSSPETQYVQALGKRLVSTIPANRSWPFEFHVIQQKEINAFALPGGPMFVNIGTITAASNEAELAGVMAHEIAHVYMQHSAKQQDKGSLLQGLAGLAGAIAGGLGGTAGTLAQAGIQIGAGTLMLKYSRADESQADSVGAIILWKAGINPVALADFFQKLQAQGGGSGPQFLSDHPNPGNRRTAIQAQVKDWPGKQYSGDSAQFASARQHAMGVRAYTGQEIEAGAKNGQWTAENRKNGAVFPNAPAGGSAAAGPASMPAVAIGQVQPSANFVLADLGGIRIGRPQNWEVVDNQEASATIAPRAGVSGGAVAYGVVIRAGRAPAANMNAGQLTAAIVKSLQSSDPNMKQASQIQGITVGGASAGSVELQTVSPMVGADGKPQAERDWLVAVPRGANTIFFVFVSPEANYGQLRPAFQKMLQSAQFR